jgi:hypothetical protein
VVRFAAIDIPVVAPGSTQSTEPRP